MRLIDRFLIVTAVLTGVLLAHGPLRGAPDSAPACTTMCQQTTKYYHCTKQHAYEYYLDDCYHCVNGTCQQRDGIPGGLCSKTDLPRKFRYVKDYTKACECDDTTFRVEITGGVNSTEWDLIDTDVYYTCEAEVTPPDDGGDGDPTNPIDPTDPMDPMDPVDPTDPITPLP
jgi:hypothetical protein